MVRGSRYGLLLLTIAAVAPAALVASCSLVVDTEGLGGADVRGAGPSALDATTDATRDADRDLLDATAPDPDGAAVDATVPGDAAACLARGTACTDQVCCSGSYCRKGSGSCVACRHTYDECSSDIECCSGTCETFSGICM